MPVLFDSAMASMMPMKSGSKSPTCKVCGDESSGYHYGVDSCEGCKGFFRRCITQGMTHKCSNEEKCEVTPFTRNSCQYCRLKKCFAVGMSREASRLGRRPKRLKDSSGEKQSTPTPPLPIAPYPSAQELYKLRMAELQRLLQQNGTFKSELMQAFLSAAQVSFREHQRNSNQKIDNQNKNKTEESGYSSLSSPTSSNQSPIGDFSNQKNLNQNLDIKEDVMNIQNVVQPDNFLTQSESNLLIPPDNRTGGQFGYMTIKTEPDNENTTTSTTSYTTTPDAASPIIQPQVEGSPLSDNENNYFTLSPTSLTHSTSLNEPDSNANVIDVERIMELVKQVPSDMRRQLIDQVTETVIEAHFKTCKPTYEAVAKANERMEMMKASNMLPDMSKLSLDPSDMWKQFVSNMVPEITLVVKFCKKLPGFAEVTQDDQIKLIKQGSFEVMLCRFCMLVDIATGSMYDPDMKMKCPRHVIMSMPMGNFFTQFFHIAEMFNPMKLTDGEIGLFSAVLLICADRRDLQNKLAIEKLNSLYAQALYTLMKKNHSDYDTMFGRLMGLIPEFRRINDEHARQLNNMKMQFPDVSNDFPALHKEVYDLEDK